MPKIDLWMGNRKQVSETVGYQSMGCVVRRDADLHAVPNHDFDSVFLHPAGKDTPYDDIVFTLNFHGTAAQNSGYLSLYLYKIVSTQDIPFSASGPIEFL